MNLRRACPLAAVLACLAGGVQAQPWFDSDDLQHNGAVSRRLWKPELASAELLGVRVSAGMAIGLRDTLQSSLGRRHAPALTLDVGPRSSVSLLAGSDGAMLVWQTAP